MQVTIKGHVFAQQNSWETKPSFTFFDFDASEWIKVVPAQVTVEIPDDWDIRPAKVDALQKELEAVRAAFQARVTEINGQIQSLLAIEA